MASLHEEARLPPTMLKRGYHGTHLQNPETKSLEIVRLEESPHLGLLRVKRWGIDAPWIYFSRNEDSSTLETVLGGSFKKGHT